MNLRPGLYEQVINKGLSKQLAETTLIPETTGIDPEESSKILAKYLSSILEKTFHQLHEKHVSLEEQISLANNLVALLKNQLTCEDSNELEISSPAEQLLSLIAPKNSVAAFNKKSPIRPETSLSQSSLFTGSSREPQLFSELKKEILSCNRIDMLVSFIKWTGLRLIMDELRQFTEQGGELRVITTSYMGATDIKAIEKLSTLQNTKIKVSYDTKRTRLHAKSYIFTRETGFTTAYVGSSNLSNTAISSGLEWNIKVTHQDLPETIKKISATFDSYWNSSEFEFYSPDKKEFLELALRKERMGTSTSDTLTPFTFDITPYPYQQEILDKLEAERTIRNNYKNLIIAATGTGKTVISALDYRNFCKKQNRQPRFLFIAHREEILEQSLSCFRGVLKDANFGELFVGNHRPTQLDHLFISIQTFNSQNFTKDTSSDFYEYIIIDEFHHAAAPSYQTLLNYYTPKILLGLTATPERMDGKDILSYFNNKISAEIRLPEAINRRLLCPFQYFGVTDDTVNLAQIHWVNGGYDKAELSVAYTTAKSAILRADLIIESVLKYVTNITDVKGLGFCVTKKHATFMAEYFSAHNIPSISLTSDSSDEERGSAQQKLCSGEIKFIFIVDLYNEGVDIPAVNTVLFLRPTESLTIFLQQLGRGLRLSEGKDCLTVLDFIGLSNKKYNFESKFMALLNPSSNSLEKEIEKGFISTPRGCFIHLEKMATKYILNNIKSSFSSLSGILSRIQSFSTDTGKPLTLTNFLDHYHIDIRELYSRKDFFARLCVKANTRENFTESLENTISNALPSVCTINSRRWIEFLLKLLPNVEHYSMEDFSPCEQRWLNMFQHTLWRKNAQASGFASPLDGFRQIQTCPTIFSELIDILRYNYEHIDFIDEPIDLGFESPLDLHCRYTRDQIFSGLGITDPSSIRQGVRYLPDKKLDVFIITLNKAEKDYSPSTMYNDYSINELLFHWQSQSTTSEKSSTGERYINHQKLGTKVMLFVRDSKKEFDQTAPFTCLGTAQYVSHEGSYPMNIIWKLDKPIPAYFLSKTNKLLND